MHGLLHAAHEQEPGLREGDVVRDDAMLMIELVERLREFVQVRGLMPLLMKRRNGGNWTSSERTALQQQLRALAHLSPYLVVLVMPGSFMVLPMLAWWLDRRRNQRSGPRLPAT